MRSRVRRGTRPTREVWALLVLTTALVVAALISANNLIYLILSAILGLWLIDAVLGPWNLRHLSVRRELPAELFAETAARGGFRVLNQRRWLPSVVVRIEDEHGDAEGVMDRLGPGDEGLVPAGWTFAGRGEAHLGRLRLGSAFPFGLMWRHRIVDLPAEILVYPRPRPAEPRVEAGDTGADGLEPAGRGAIGDLEGLKDYAPGDPVRRIHWRTTARVGHPVIVLRTDEQADRVTVRVRNLHGRAWEHELSRASGEVLRAFHRGCRVGLELPDARIEARGGPVWRRTLLEVLARLPERGA
jgi:uncharacterized protein (DUF58 family)